MSELDTLTERPLQEQFIQARSRSLVEQALASQPELFYAWFGANVESREAADAEHAGAVA